MRRGRVTYLPITFIVIGIVILAVAVAAMSYRDINRGRAQTGELLWRQARAALEPVPRYLMTVLSHPEWQPERIAALFPDASDPHSPVVYLAVIDEGGKVLLHGDAEQVGKTLPDPDRTTIVRMPVARRAGMPPGVGVQVVDVAIGVRIFDLGGRRVYEYRRALELPPPASGSYRQRRLRGPMGMLGMPRSEPAMDPELVATRLSELLGRDVSPDSPIIIRAVVGIDATELESAFNASRNHTILVSAVLVLVGGAAIYFLSMLGNYRATRTALENMRSYTTNVIESMASGLVSLDADGNVATVNRGARSILGLGGDDPGGEPARSVLRLASESDRRDLDAVVAGEREIFEAETRVAGRDGPIPVALAASSLKDEDGERAGTVILFQDLREVEELKDAVERERHLASLGRLAAGVAHEVRNPLSSLKGFAQLFRTKFTPGSEEERYSDIMIEEVERLDRVVQELLDFAKPVAPDRRTVAPNTLVEEALALVSEDAQFKRVEVKTSLADGLPNAHVDPMQMRQAILNVLLNAIEAMGDGGTLTLETSLTTVPGSPTAVTISVSDTGPGLSEEEVSRLFEPFYTTKPRGTGLGLTVVSRVVEQNGGRVFVKSVPGRGTTFSLVLPTSGGH